MFVEVAGMRGKPRSGMRRSRGPTADPVWVVSDALWERVAHVLEDRPQRMGRPRYPARACLEGILFVLFTGSQWARVPYLQLGLPSGETCRRRLEQWQQEGRLEVAFVELREALRVEHKIDLSRVIVDASSVDAKKGAPRSRVLCVAATAHAGM